MHRRDFDDAYYYVKDIEANVLHGEHGGPFPYADKRAAAAAAQKKNAAKNGRLGKKTFFVVTWLQGKIVA